MASYLDALRSRLDLIDQRGEEKTQWDRLRNARARQQQMNDQALAWQQGILDQQEQRNSNIAGIPGNITSGGNGFESFVNSIARKESGGNYKAVNKYSGALGKYQIMPSNITGKGRGWDYNALGYDVSTSQFLNSPQIQEKVARYQLQQYYKKYGPAGASIAWYAGPGAAQKYVNSGHASTNTQAWGFPSIASYMHSVLGSM